MNEAGIMFFPDVGLSATILPNGQLNTMRGVLYVGCCFLKKYAKVYNVFIKQLNTMRVVLYVGCCFKKIMLKYIIYS